MKKAQTEYYFSTIVLLVTTIFMAIFAVGPTYLFFKFYKDNLAVAIVALLPAMVILIGLPDYLRFMYCKITRKPALVLTSESLINNTDGKVYNWNDIKSISYKSLSGYRAPPGGYISVTLRNPESEFRIPQNSIKCKTKNLLKDLQKYHRAYHRLNFDKINGSN